MTLHFADVQFFYSSFMVDLFELYKGRIHLMMCDSQLGISQYAAIS